MKRAAAVLVVLLVVGVGCSNMKSWSYAPEPRLSTAPTVGKSCVVLPFEDGRENTNRNRLMLYMVPILPFGWADCQTPEGIPMHFSSGMWQFRPVDDLARAVAQEVENRRIFRETFVGNRASEGDLVLTGRIQSTRYKARMYSYFLSVYGPLLWMVGLPAGSYSNELTIDLRLAKTPSDPPLWTHTIQERIGGVSWIYWMKPDFRYDELLKQGIKKALPSLAEAVAKSP